MLRQNRISACAIKIPYWQRIHGSAIIIYIFRLQRHKWFTENVTNKEKVMGVPNESPFVKDAFHSALIKGENLDALKKKKNGTKFSPVYKIRIEGGKTESIYLRLSNKVIANPFTLGFKKIFEVRKQEANAIL